MRAELAQRGIAAEHLAGAAAGPRDYLRALRPHQWLKNLLVFLPLLAGHQFAMATLLQSQPPFWAYLINSSIVASLTTLLTLVLALPAAYGLARSPAFLRRSSRIV